MEDKEDKKRERLSQVVKDLKGRKSLRKLARELKVSAVTIYSWENKDTIPSLESLEKIADLKGWTIYQLLAFLRDESLEEVATFENVAKKARKLSDSDKLKLASEMLSQVQS